MWESLESSFWPGVGDLGKPSPEQAASRAALFGAETLVRKAVVALEKGDRERAEMFAAMAAGRPYGEFEGVWPGPWMARFVLYQVVSDVVEHWPEDDHGWVDVLSEVAAALTGRQLEELRHLAAVLADEASAFGSEGVEERRLREVAAGVSSDVEMPGAEDEQERPGYVLDLAELTYLVDQRLAAAARSGFLGEG